MQGDGHTTNTRGDRTLAICLGSLVALAVVPFLMRVQGGKGSDFPAFWAAGRHILEQGTRLDDSLLYRYLPSVDAAWAAFGWMPLAVAAPVYYALSAATWLGLLGAVRAWLLPAVPEPQRRRVVLLAAILTIVFALDHLMLGAFHILMLWLLVAGLGRVMQGRGLAGAAMVGAAIWLKLLPLLAVPYLLLKRQWKAACLSVLAAVALDVVMSVAAYGAAGAWTTHAAWWRAHAVGDLHALLNTPGPIEDQRDRNQSLAAVLRRNLTHMGADPARASQPWMPGPLADLPAPGLKACYLAMAGLAAACLGWYWRRPARSLDPSRTAVEIATVCLATLWFSPILFSYHPVAALPALAILLAGPPGRLKHVSLVAWVVATVLLAVPQARFVGEILWASGLLGLALVLQWRESRGDCQQHMDAVASAR